MKRFSVLLLYLVAFVCLLNAKVIKGDCGAGMTWSFDSDKGILAFSGSGAMFDYSNGTPWNLYINDIKTVVLAKNVTDMPYYALKGCLSIETIKTEDGGNFFVEGNCLLTKSDSTLIFAAKNFSIPSSTRIIGAKSFYENPSLQTLAIPEGVVTIAEQAFAKCIALKTVSIPSTVEKISTGAFYGCSSLTSVDIPKEGLVNIGKQTFAKCVSLKEINIPSTVKSIGLGAFAKCSSIESVTIPSSTELINMGAFQDCTGLKSLTIEEGVKVIGEYAFQECSSLAFVNIPSTVININNNVFDRCINLRDLQISESNEKFYSRNNKIYAKAVNQESKTKTTVQSTQEVKTKDAQFHGGISELSKWIKGNVIYPKECLDDSIEVTVKFIVEADGSITNIEVVGGTNKVLSDEVIRSIKIMPKWEPAERGNQRVRSSVKLLLVVGKDGSYGFPISLPEEPASFPGGDDECMRWLQRTIKYPSICKKLGVQGRVIVSFIVDRDGSIEDVKVVRSPSEHLSYEVLRIIKLMPKWKPARENNKAVRSMFTLPVIFRL